MKKLLDPAVVAALLAAYVPSKAKEEDNPPAKEPVPEPIPAA